MKKLITLITLLIVYQLSGMEIKDAAPETALKKAKTQATSAPKNLLMVAENYYHTGKKKEAITAFQRVLEQSTITQEHYFANAALGSLFGPENPAQTQSAWATACTYYKNALRILDAMKTIAPEEQKQKFLQSQIAMLRNLTHASVQALDNQNAITYGKIALERVQNPAIQAYLCKTIGICYRPTDIESSITYLEKGINLLLEHHSGREAGLYSNKELKQMYGELHKELANTHWLKKSSLKEAKTNYQTSLKFTDSLRDRADIWVQLGLIFMKEKNDDMATVYLESAAQDSIQAINPQAYGLAKNMLTKLPKRK